MARLLNFLGIVTALAWTGTIAVVTIAAFLVSDRWGHACHRLWGKVCLWLVGVDLALTGEENLPPLGRGFILAPNHESYFDILVLCALPVNFKWVAKEEVGKIPLIGWAVKAMGSFFVRRDGSSRDLNVLKNVETGLQEGHRIVIFPEGTRTLTGELLPFKKGAFRTAQNAGVPLLPVAIQGTYRIADKGKWFPARRHHQVGVRIGTPFFIRPEEDLRGSMARYRELLIRLINEPVNAGAKSKPL